MRNPLKKEQAMKATSNDTLDSKMVVEALAPKQVEVIPIQEGATIDTPVVKATKVKQVEKNPSGDTPIEIITQKAKASTSHST